ncbi:MAG: chemotaxis protein CheX [Pyrinomonadaceae bacterium]|nr:chemotaxis protein CheX [Pyrinomonadaceae bacterium]
MEQALYRAAILTFEELGFMFPVENNDGAELENSASVNVSVDFDGTISGRLVLQVENSVLPVLAANMLGVDESPEEDLMSDVLGEFANVICGNALPSIAGKQKIFRLQPPQIVVRFDSDENPSAEARLQLDEGRANVRLYVN